MNKSLWVGTPVENILADAWKSPVLRILYFVGQIELTTFETFGVLPDTDADPHAVLFARAMLRALMAPENEREAFMVMAQQIASAWRAEREVH